MSTNNRALNISPVSQHNLTTQYHNTPQPHVHHQRGVGVVRCSKRRVCQHAVVADARMPSQVPHRGSQASVCEGDAQLGSNATGSSDPRHGDGANATGAQVDLLLTAPAENKRVPSFQSENGGTGACELGHEGMDFVLGAGVEALLLADVDHAGAVVYEGQNFIRDESVVEDDVGGLHEPQCAQCEEAGVARARADEVDGAGVVVGGRCGQQV